MSQVRNDTPEYETLFTASLLYHKLEKMFWNVLPIRTRRAAIAENADLE